MVGLRAPQIGFQAVALNGRVIDELAAETDHGGAHVRTGPVTHDVVERVVCVGGLVAVCGGVAGVGDRADGIVSDRTSGREIACK